MNPAAHAYLGLHDEDGGLSDPSRHRGRALVLLLTLALTSFTLLVAASPAVADHVDSDSLIRSFGDDDSELSDDDGDGDDDNSTGSAGDSGDDGASTSGATEGTSVGTGGDTTGKGDPCAPGDTDDTSNDGSSGDGDTTGGDSNDTSGDGNSGDGDTGGDDSDDTSGDGNSHDGDSGDDGDSVDGDGDELAAEACAPGIDVDKSAAESSVERGGTINYTIVVRNTGNAPLTVTPVDQACAGFDGAVFQLAPGATKTLTCSHVAGSADGTAYRNEACVSGVASGGQTVGDCDDAVTPITDPPVVTTTTTTTTTTPPADQGLLGDQVGGVSDPVGQIVLGERIIPGRARLIGATGCRGKAFNVRVVGRQMATVTFRLDGRVVKTVRRAGSRATLRINPLRLSLGVHRLVATVRFNASSRTRARTLRLSFQRCARALQAPRFTG